MMRPRLFQENNPWQAMIRRRGSFTAQQERGPRWRASAIDVARRRTLVGLSGLFIAVAGSTPVRAQVSRSCVLRGGRRGPVYLDPNLVRSDITAGQPEPRCNWRWRSCAPATAPHWPTHASMSGTPMVWALFGLENNRGRGIDRSSGGAALLRGTQFTMPPASSSSGRYFPAVRAGARRTSTSKCSSAATRSSAKSIPRRDEQRSLAQWQPMSSVVLEAKHVKQHTSMERAVYWDGRGVARRPTPPEAVLVSRAAFEEFF